MPFELPQLPFAQDALAPHMSEETLSYHYGKHHAGYIKKLNAAIEGTEWADKSLEDIIRKAQGGLFNNAAQVWNHTFFWNCLKPNGGGKPTGDIGAAITRSFGSYDSFKEQFSAACAGQFGSGWGWLVQDQDGGEVSIMTTSNADTPIKHGKVALLTIDVWEHAYYIDYRNARATFISSVLDNLVNWHFVSRNLG